ncbi:hypothetical protein PAHAL_5G325100 [Panicum hallii]|uniref:Uncharacterized protein n=1 Tax=Panicum hallii TaxID=206008 RepID=A0A2T8ILX7_9POAL|nr:hypothetical protein PAHAL_5G325100 [Panicum hallii]
MLPVAARRWVLADNNRELGPCAGFTSRGAPTRISGKQELSDTSPQHHECNGHPHLAHHRDKELVAAIGGKGCKAPAFASPEVQPFLSQGPEPLSRSPIYVARVTRFGVHC